MEKSRKLRRYSRKDYTQVVDFPVEIVGRDGVVRRYSFEESVRLYQRRIASANHRYDDREIVDAEVVHCRKRIAQLRRSYFARYGWESLQRIDGRQALEESLAGEVAAFLRRCLLGSEADPETFRFALVSEDTLCQVFFVQPAPAGAALSDDEHERAPRPPERYLLYAYQFTDPGSCPGRDAFFEFLKVLQGVRHIADGVETLVGFHHTADWGLVLTGKASEVRALEGAIPPDELPPGAEVLILQMSRSPDPLREALIQMRQGRLLEALQQFEAAYEANHYRQLAYTGAAVVADAVGRPERGEIAARMGAAYFPEDRVMHHHLGVALLRQGDLVGSRRAIDRSVACGGEDFASLLLGALWALVAGHPREGWRLLRLANAEQEGREPDLERTLAVLRRMLGARALQGALGLVVALGCFVIGVAGSANALILLGAVGVGVTGHAALTWRRQLRKALVAEGILRLAISAPLRVPAESDGPR